LVLRYPFAGESNASTIFNHPSSNWAVDRPNGAVSRRMLEGGYWDKCRMVRQITVKEKGCRIVVQSGVSGIFPFCTLPTKTGLKSKLS
jgi:hypothetical protein